VLLSLKIPHGATLNCAALSRETLLPEISLGEGRDEADFDKQTNHGFSIRKRSGDRITISESTFGKKKE
jgi:hypothetical protein